MCPTNSLQMIGAVCEIKSKREALDKAVQNAKEYNVDVRRTLVIDYPRQLKSLKELYAKYAGSH